MRVLVVALTALLLLTAGAPAVPCCRAPRAADRLAPLLKGPVMVFKEYVILEYRLSEGTSNRLVPFGVKTLAHVLGWVTDFGRLSR